ncbi:septation protein A [Pasteurella canis]|uniref:septation protein A n=1 Tax=Pasteurella canis TaxID=753 RepID=UPI000664E6B6|nr:septation protein A [Pasteurella canis]MXN87995.1 septation protein A [Pasteurella canis]UAX43106.1 septation protein A [Pasteurella canis]UDW84764.1 septation protein A [Pasteurella canis]UEA15895.1 septation protein A [Pasteurella canis]UEC24232.1 septation protein A [Pasteurella canis]
MKQLLEFIPLILFFAVYKLVGIREAALTLMIATVIQLLILKIKYGKVEKQQLIMGVAVVFFGALTAYFNQLEYLKWKVTIVYAIFALVLLISRYGFNKNLIQLMLSKDQALELPERVWHNLNLGWAAFFILCMLINIYISQYLSDDLWVDFKTFGILGMTLIATVITGIYIYRYLPQANKNNKE